MPRTDVEAVERIEDAVLELFAIHGVDVERVGPGWIPDISRGSLAIQIQRERLVKTERLLLDRWRGPILLSLRFTPLEPNPSGWEFEAFLSRNRCPDPTHNGDGRRVGDLRLMVELARRWLVEGEDLFAPTATA